MIEKKLLYPILIGGLIFLIAGLVGIILPLATPSGKYNSFLIPGIIIAVVGALLILIFIYYLFRIKKINKEINETK